MSARPAPGKRFSRARSPRSARITREVLEILLEIPQPRRTAGRRATITWAPVTVRDSLLHDVHPEGQLAAAKRSLPRPGASPHRDSLTSLRTCNYRHLGDRTQIAEHCSARDHEHDVSATSLRSGPLRYSPVCIGEDAWICRGAAVLKGAVIEAGAAVGANAVAIGRIPANTVAVGIPARVVHARKIR